MRRLKIYLCFFYILLFFAGILPFLISLNEYLNYHKKFYYFLLKEREKLKHIIRGETKFLTQDIEFIISLNEKINLIYKKSEIPIFPEEFKELKKETLKKDFFVDKRGKFWVFLPEEKIVARYEEIPLIYEDFKNSRLKPPFFLFFTLNFLLLLYLISKILGGLISWMENRNIRISDFLHQVVEYPFLKEIEEKEKKRRFFEIAEIISVFSHEIKNSLQSLISYLRLIKNNLKDELFENIYKEIMSVNEILEDYTRYIIKGEEIPKEEVNIKEVIEEALLEIKKEERIKIKKELKEMNLYGNKILLKKAFLNIIENAIEAIEGEGIIFIKTEKKNKKGIILIEDTGKGMDEKVLKRAIEPFFTTKARGFGLGLSFVKRVAEMHNIEFKIESKREKGTKIIMKFNL